MSACQGIYTGESISLIERLDKIIKDNENKSIKLIFKEKTYLEIPIVWIGQDHSADNNIVVIALPDNNKIENIEDGKFMKDGIRFIANSDDDKLTNLLEKSIEQIEFENRRQKLKHKQCETTTKDITNDVTGACERIYYTKTVDRVSKEVTEISLTGKFKIIKNNENKSIKLIFNERKHLEIPIRMIIHIAADNTVIALPRNNINDITDGSIMHDGIHFVAKSDYNKLTQLLEKYEE